MPKNHASEGFSSRASVKLSIGEIFGLSISITANEGYAPDGDFGSVTIDDGPPYPLLGYFLDQTLGTLYLVFAFGGTYTFALNFSEETRGWFTGQAYQADDGLWPFFGTFQVVPNE